MKSHRSKRGRFRFRKLATLLILAAPVAAAHDTWVLPVRPAVSRGSEISLDATSGMGFPALDFAIQPDRISVARFRLEGRTAEISRRTGAKHSLRLAVRPEGEGIACLWIESKPKAIDLKPDQVREYLEEIGALDTVGKEWSAAGSTGRWREIYTKHAKTFVAVGASGGDRSWAEPAGMRLEIVPESDPTQLKAKSDFSVRLLKDGRPLPGFPMGMVQAGQKTGEVRKTDANGRVSFKPDKKGWVLLRTTDLRRAGTHEADWESDFATLTLRVE
jgi:uncharacterized GH25 family protein